MEDEKIIKKSTIFFIIFLIIIAICLIIYFIFDKENESLNTNSPDESIDDTNKEESPVNETGIYGLFINSNDANSYFKYNEDGTFKFILNICEGYITYNNDNATLSKNVTVIDNKYEVTINITPKSTKDINKIGFISNSFSEEGVVDIYDGPNSCSHSIQYKRS